MEWPQQWLKCNTRTFCSLPFCMGWERSMQVASTPWSCWYLPGLVQSPAKMTKSFKLREFSNTVHTHTRLATAVYSNYTCYYYLHETKLWMWQRSSISKVIFQQKQSRSTACINVSGVVVITPLDYVHKCRHLLQFHILTLSLPTLLYYNST